MVAIVDDDESLRTSTSLLLACFGLRSAAFARGRDFLAWPLLKATSCLILDVVMPDLDGLELQRQLWRTCPGLPIIFVTGHAKERQERQAMSAGAVAVLRKPVAQESLLQALHQALYPGSPLSPEHERHK